MEGKVLNLIKGKYSHSHITQPECMIHAVMETFLAFVSLVLCVKRSHGHKDKFKFSKFAQFDDQWKKSLFKFHFIHHDTWGISW